MEILMGKSKGRKYICLSEQFPIMPPRDREENEDADRPIFEGEMVFKGDFPRDKEPGETDE